MAARYEQARGLDDVLLRRTRLALLAAPELRTAASVTAAAEVLGAELGWERDRIEAEAAGWPDALADAGADPAGLAAATSTG